MSSTQVQVEGSNLGALVQLDGTFRLLVTVRRPVLVRLSRFSYCPWVRSVGPDDVTEDLELALEWFPPNPSDGPPMAVLRGDLSIHWPASTENIRCILSLQEAREGRIRALGDEPDWNLDLREIAAAVLLDETVVAKGNDIRGSSELWVVLDAPELEGLSPLGSPMPYRIATPHSALRALDRGEVLAVAVITTTEVAVDELTVTVHFEAPGRQWPDGLLPAEVHLERQGTAWQVR